MDLDAYAVPSLAQGALVTATITLAAIAIGAIAAFVAGIARVEGGRVAGRSALVYTELFRGTSLLVQLFWFYYALPLVGLSLRSGHDRHRRARRCTSAPTDRRSSAARLNAVPVHQHEAARALNFGRGHTLLHDQPAASGRRDDAGLRQSRHRER